MHSHCCGGGCVARKAESGLLPVLLTTRHPEHPRGGKMSVGEEGKLRSLRAFHDMVLGSSLKAALLGN